MANRGGRGFWGYRAGQRLARAHGLFSVREGGGASDEKGHVINHKLGVTMWFGTIVGGSLVAGSALAAHLMRRRGRADAEKRPVEKAAAAQSLRLRGAGEAKVVSHSTAGSFPWGTEPFAMSLMPACILLGAAGVAACVSFTTPSGPMTSLELARGPVLVTVFWIWAFYNCIGAQLGVKMGDKGDAKACLIAERSLMNTLEQSVAFLPLLWMYAACIDAAVATSVGGFYVAMRMCYPLAYSFYGGFSMLCEFITQPNYACINFFAASLVCFGLGHGSLVALTGSSMVAVFPTSMALSILSFTVLWNYPVAAFAAARNLRYNPAKP